MVSRPAIQAKTAARSVAQQTLQSGPVVAGDAHCGVKREACVVPGEHVAGVIGIEHAGAGRTSAASDTVFGRLLPQDQDTLLVRTLTRETIWSPCARSPTRSRTRSHPRSLPSMVRLNRARSRILWSICSRIRIAQICFSAKTAKAPATLAQ